MTKSTTAILSGCLWASLALGCADSDKPTMDDNTPATNADEGKSPSSAKPASSSDGPAAQPSSSDAAKDTPSSSGSANTPSMTTPPAGNANTNTPSMTTPPAGNANNNMPSGSASQTPGMIDWNGDIRGLCNNFKTPFPDDHACIPAPPADQGMQIHVGPSNYDDPDEVAKYILHPGEESSECFGVITSNDKKIFYQTAHLSGRAGTHHIIDSMFDGGGAEAGPADCKSMGAAMQLGALPGASKPYMPRLSVAPEYAHVGKSIPPHALMQADMHYYNFTDKDLLREFWINVYYAKAEDITEEAQQIALLGGFSWNQNPIQPGTDKTYQYTQTIKGDGYILMLLGHYHAHGKQFVASITRKATGKDEKVFEMFDYMDPAEFEYNSIVTNPTFSPGAAGATTGRLQVFDGDKLNWSCHIVNDGDVPLKYVNEVKTGEMCNLWGTSIGTQAISAYMP